MIHEPVLLKETLKVLSPAKGEAYLDLTSGYGGHAQAVLSITEEYRKSVLIDRDQNAIDHLSKQFASSGTRLIKNNFLSACQQLIAEKQKFDLIMADLGVSSPHLNIASRGFSFMQNGPLDMRMDLSDSLTANEIVNNYSEAELTRIIFEYGEERQSKRIASAIIQARPLETTTDLARLIESKLGWKQKGHHPATRTFQALRIAVNQELRLLESVLPLSIQLLNKGGRLAIITFHSLEDRIVKKFFQELSFKGYDAEYALLTKKPIEATHSELVTNPRARSAKLRALVKIKTERTD